MSGYKNLGIYQHAHNLVISVHQLSFRLPTHELYEMGSQIRRCSKSISANIVEGYGRRSYESEFIRFLIFAQSSLDETREWLNYIKELYPELLDENFQKTEDLALQTGRMLGAFIRKQNERKRSGSTSKHS